MDFSLNENQLEVQNLVSQVFKAHATQDRLRELDEHGYHDDALWAQLAELGLLGVAIDSDQGGIGESFETLCVLLEQAGTHVAPLPLIEVLVSGAFALHGHPLVADALAAVAGGQGVITAALAEPGESHVLQPKTQAEPDGATWRLSGRKHLVAVADRPGVCWTVAQAGDGLGVYLFDLHANGITRERQISTTGEYLFELQLNEVAAQRLAVGEDALRLIERAQCLGMAATAAMAVGVCSAMTKMAAAYTSEREQFGKPIATFQAVAHRLADCHINTEALRGLTQQAVSNLSKSVEWTSEEMQSALMAKIFSAQALHQVSHATQQVHGGTGVDRDYPLFRYCLLAKKLELSFGAHPSLLQQLGKIEVEAA